MTRFDFYPDALDEAQARANKQGTSWVILKSRWHGDFMLLQGSYQPFDQTRWRWCDTVTPENDWRYQIG